MADEPIKPELNPNSLVPNQPPISKQPVDFDDVALGGISMRGLLTFILVAAVVIETAFGAIKPDTLIALALTSFGFYFAKNKS